MLASGLVVVSLLLATHGAEGTREEKFRGALVAQAELPTPPPAVEAESAEVFKTRASIAGLVASRPTFVAPGVTMAVAGGMTLLGLLGIFIGIPLIAGSTDFVATVLIVGGVILGGAGLFVGAIAMIVFIATGIEVAVIDGRIRQLEATLPGRTSSLPAAPQTFALASF